MLCNGDIDDNIETSALFSLFSQVEKIDVLKELEI